jgi:phage regulator Rha-like protein
MDIQRLLNNPVEFLGVLEQVNGQVLLNSGTLSILLGEKHSRVIKRITRNISKKPELLGMCYFESNLVANGNESIYYMTAEGLNYISLKNPQSLLIKAYLLLAFQELEGILKPIGENFPCLRQFSKHLLN